MNKKLITLLVVLLTTALFVIGCSREEGEATIDLADAPTLDTSAMANPNSLIDLATFMELREQDNVVVVDMSENSNNVIPGAIWIDRSSLYHEVDGGRMTIQSADVVAQILGEHGISNDTTVITYCENNNLWASRFLWVLRAYGHQDVRMLNGGTNAWIEAGGTTGSPAEPGEAVTYVPNMDNFHAIRADLQDVIYATNNPDFAILDIRSQDEWDAGRVPGAIQFTFPVDLINPDGTFKTVAEYQALFAHVPDATLIVYCLGGVRASVLYFVLTDFLGFDVQNYEGSWWNYEASGEPIETD
jgi:thiosulfate/3-mercaptopyruvate sulfurtransferase